MPGKLHFEALAQDVITSIIDIHWPQLYLYVSITATNQEIGRGPAAVAAVPRPSATVSDDDIELIDERHNPTSIHRFGLCMQYLPVQEGVIDFGPPYQLGTLTWSDPIYGPVGQSAQAAYDEWFSQTVNATTSVTASAEGACSTASVPYPLAYQKNVSATESREEYYYVNLSTVPVDDASVETLVDEYLYKIQASDDLLSIKVSELIENVISATARSGFGRIDVSVYSRAKEEITSLSQIIQYGGDESPKLDPDDTRVLNMDSDKQESTIRVSVEKDTDEAHQQTDNYGETFQPWKVIFEPGLDSIDVIPSQPPQQLPLPSGAARRRRRINARL